MDWTELAKQGVADQPERHSLTQLRCVVWVSLQGRPLYTVKERGVLAQGRNLVLQRVNRQAAGSYQCIATNAISSVTSPSAFLDVMCECYYLC